MNSYISTFKQNYLFKIALSFMGICGLWFAAFELQLGVPTQSSDWVHAAYTLKERRASELNEPKWVIVAGSSALFGYDSEMLEAALHKPVVNFGVNAGLQLPYILKRAQSVLKQGDVALLALEYSHYQYDGSPSVMLIDYVSSRDPQYFYQASIKQKIQFIYGMDISRLIGGVAQRFFPRSFVCHGVYCIDNINEYGDQINISTDHMTPYEHALVAQENATVGFSPMTSAAQKQLLNFLAWAKAHEVTVLVTPPNLIQYSVYHANQSQVFFNQIQSFFADNNTPFVGNVYQHMFDKAYSFNGGYHLNRDGVILNTQRLLSELDQAKLLPQTSG